MNKYIIIISVFILVVLGITYLNTNYKPGISETSTYNQSESECEKYGGEESNLTECNGEINIVCTLPNGETCYLDHFKEGKCEGVFSPKVLCDNYQ